MRLTIPSALVVATVGVGSVLAEGALGSSERHLAGSVQLDYLANPRGVAQPDQGLRGGTVELTLKLTMDFGEHVSSNVKVCFACHGFELGMAFFDLRVADELNVRVGRFTPAFGSFPLRSDPANHSTSDKPLPYDMGRMTRLREWNEGVLPAPWVDNGIEVNGAHFFGKHIQLDYAAYAIGGPKGDANATDFDFKQSRSPERYYVDNNVEPALGGRVSVTADIAPSTILTVGGSVMTGHYDPDARLGFTIVGGDVALQLGRTFLRAEYLIRRTEIALGDDPASRFKYGPNTSGQFSDYTLKDGFVAEILVPVGRIEMIGRWDGLRQTGNVLATSTLRSRSVVLRYTGGIAYRLTGALRLKTSAEVYDFSDYSDELVFHLGLAGPF
ncbi:MAG: hypothetical protein ABI867_39240 [Kofleriaceae bacterium]